MNKHTLSVLKFSKIKKMLIKYTVSAIAEEIVNKIKPEINFETIVASQKETTEMREILAFEGSPPFSRTEDIRDELKKSKIVGTILDTVKILKILKVLKNSRLVKKYFLKLKDKYPLIKRRLEKIKIFKDLEEEINYCIGENAEVLNRASSELKKIRKEIIKKEQNIKNKLDKIIKSPHFSDVIQDPIVTIRQDRYVIPIKQGRKTKFPGIIHDKSDSGATLFIEPFELVELNNGLRQLIKDEQREILKILQKITAHIGEKAEGIYNSYLSLGEVDFIYARALLADKMNAIEPNLNQKGFVNLIQARHPLLSGNVVSININVGKEFDILLITGPNTGGKTVALKTVGLLAVMAQCGLHIPAVKDSEIAVFQKIFCDIGDEQNIEQSLSTFSSHMKYIVQILEEADSNSLVLLDELGAGTDPTEGAALSMALLDTLKQQKVKVVASTHHDTLKTYAYLTEGVCNARVEFDEKTLEPTYQISIGLPGRSCAFIIAQRLGLSSEVISKAQNFLSREKIKADNLIKKIEQDKKIIEKKKEQTEKIEEKSYKIKDKLTEELGKVENDKKEIMLKAYQRAEEIIKQTQDRANNIINNLKKKKILDKQSSKNIISEIREIDRKLKDETLKLKPKKELDKGRKIKKGDYVLIKNLKKKGEVISIFSKTKKCKVQIDNMKILVPIFDLERINKLEKSNENTNPVYSIPYEEAGERDNLFLSKMKYFKNQLSIRQLKVEEAQIKLEKYLDDAYYLGVSPVYIIHGKGKGILREEVKKMLSVIPYIESFRIGNPSEGGIGVTIAYLKK
ncbi:MAG: endonuclease MutS2 [Candidatus Caldatribacteriota bacterium]|nr:endonuclease MutS2 [Candidatus Caldatribacteriota bacterium]